MQKMRMHLCLFFCAAHSIPARRSKHCYSEAQRVLDFQSLCQENKGEESNDQILRQLGSLMNASQESCRDLYNCSCPELDRLVEICRWVCHFHLLWCRPSESANEIYRCQLYVRPCFAEIPTLRWLLNSFIKYQPWWTKPKMHRPLFVDKWPDW